MTTNFRRSQTALVKVAQAAPDLGGFAQRLVEVLEVEDGGAVVRDDEIQSPARSLGAGLHRLVAVAQPFREAPCPNRHRAGAGQPLPHLGQHTRDPLLFGGANVGERPSGLEDLPDDFRRAAFPFRNSWDRILRRHSTHSPVADSRVV